MIMEKELSIPIYMLFLIISSFIMGFLLWSKRKKFKLRYELIFDFIIFYIISSIITGRLIFLLENYSNFRHISWSIYPYYYDPGAERVWLKQMPWIILEFWDD